MTVPGSPVDMTYNSPETIMEDSIIGIDIAKSSFVAANNSTSTNNCREFANHTDGFQAFEDWLETESIDQAWICMEATGNYELKLAAWLLKSGHHVSIVNPARVAAFADGEIRRNKTDKSDACLLARFCKAHQPELWSSNDDISMKLQQLVRRVQALKSMCTKEKNRLHHPQFNDQVTQTVHDHIEFLETQLDNLWKQINAVIDEDDKLNSAVELVESIPGIGYRTAVILVAEIRDIERFASAKKLAGHAGVTPENVQSGSSPDEPAHMSKKGSAEIRNVLYMAALSARTYNPVVRRFCEQLKARGKPPKVIIGAAMHKLIRLVYGVWTNGEAFDPSYAVST